MEIGTPEGSERNGVVLGALEVQGIQGFEEQSPFRTFLRNR